MCYVLIETVWTIHLSARGPKSECAPYFAFRFLNKGEYWAYGKSLKPRAYKLPGLLISLKVWLELVDTQEA